MQISGRSIISALDRLAERKFFDRTFYTLNVFVNPINWDGRIFDLTSVAQGIGDSNRIGDKILVGSVEMRLYMYPDATTPPVIPNQAYRFIIFKWYDDTTPTVADVLQFSTAGGAGNIVAPFEHDKSIKREVLVDFCLPTYRDIAANTTIRSGWNTPLYEDVTISLDNRSIRVRQVSYQGSTVTGVGKFYLLAVSNTDPVHDLTDPLHYTITTRVNYTDM